MILGVMLISAGNLTFAQKAKPTPPHSTNTGSAEWERVREGLKKAKPMPEPSHTVTSKTGAPHGRLAGFDPKAGQVTTLPKTEAPADNGVQHKGRKSGDQPTNVNQDKHE
jgi:hypothetical protein